MDQEIDESSPLLNPLILEKVFQHLDHLSLKGVRQVCHGWNGVAASILTKKSQTILKSACEVNQYQKCYSSYGDIRPLPKGYGDVDHKKLNDTLNWSVNPEVIFQNLHLDFALLEDVKFLPILKEYGSLVKSAVLQNCSPETQHGRLVGLLREDELQTLLYPFLTQYCPNLVNLKVRVQCQDEQFWRDKARPRIRKIKIGESLNLEGVDIDVQDFYGRIPVERELNFLLEVIKASPRLKRLNVTAAPASVQAQRFCKGISTLVNLEEFRWSFVLGDYYKGDPAKLKNVMDMFQIICKMEMKKLRILSLGDLILMKKYTSKIMPELLKFFKRNGRNLGTLTLMDVEVIWDDRFQNDQLLFSTLEFQEMLTFCPSIATIHINALYYWYNITDLKSCNPKPCLSLSKLVLSNRTVLSVESFNAITEWFPNLVYFSLDHINYPYHLKVGALNLNEPRTLKNTKAETYIMDVVKTLETLEKLQELELGASFCCKDYEEFSLGKIIQAAKNVPGLRRLTFMDQSYRMRSYKMRDLQDTLMQTKGFDSVRFGNFLMDGDEDTLGITTLLTKNKLPVNFFRKREQLRVVDPRLAGTVLVVGFGPAYWMFVFLYLCILFLLFCLFLYVVFTVASNCASVLFSK